MWRSAKPDFGHAEKRASWRRWPANLSYGTDPWGFVLACLALATLVGGILLVVGAIVVYNLPFTCLGAFTRIFGLVTLTASAPGGLLLALLCAAQQATRWSIIKTEAPTLWAAIGVALSIPGSLLWFGIGFSLARCH
jgi:hypothetical protein